MQTLSVILETYRDNADIQGIWIKCILPLVLDSETTVQAKALSVLEEQFLQKVFSSKQQDWESAFILLKMISSDDFLAHQRYLQKAFGLWKSEKKLRLEISVFSFICFISCFSLNLFYNSSKLYCLCFLGEVWKGWGVLLTWKRLAICFATLLLNFL